MVGPRKMDAAAPSGLAMPAPLPGRLVERRDVVNFAAKRAGPAGATGRGLRGEEDRVEHAGLVADGGSTVDPCPVCLWGAV